MNTQRPIDASEPNASPSPNPDPGQVKKGDFSAQALTLTLTLTPNPHQVKKGEFSSADLTTLQGGKLTHRRMFRKVTSPFLPPSIPSPPAP